MVMRGKSCEKRGVVGSWRRRTHRASGWTRAGAALALAWLAGSAPAAAGLFEGPCNPGTVSKTGQTPCSACPAGSFADAFGSTQCMQCPTGTFASHSGSAQCDVCAAGTYADDPGSTECVRDEAIWPVHRALPSLPCEFPDDLERCIEDGVRDGGVIHVVDEDIEEQDVFIRGKSFTLRAGDGVTPEFAGDSVIAADGGDGDVRVEIEGLTLKEGRIRARQAGSGRFAVAIRNNTILRTKFGTAIDVSSVTQTSLGPTDFEIADNTIHIGVAPATQASAIAFIAFGSAAKSGVIRGNRIEQIGGGQGRVIDVSNADAPLAIDVVGNRISGSQFNNGIAIVQSGGGSVTALIANNAVSGQVNVAGASGAIVAKVDQGIGLLTIVNNSVAFNERGLIATGQPGPSVHVTAAIANNIIAFNTTGLNIEDINLESNAANLVFGNGSDSFTAGPGTLGINPLFVSFTDLALQPLSPARNAGDNAYVPADLLVDITGAPRIIGSSVDIGAYEVPEPANGLAAMTALACLLLLGVRKRRRLLRVSVAALLALLGVGTATPAAAGLFSGPCNPGTVSKTGQTPCSACPAGTFAGASGSTQCTQCPVGTFANHSGSAQCEACAAGTYADVPGSTACVRDEVFWPSFSASCEDLHDLDACIENGIRDGGVVAIVEDVVPAQNVSIEGKSFTLRSAGFQVPVFGGTSLIEVKGGDSDATVVIEGLTIERGRIEVNQRGLGHFRATIRENEILDSPTSLPAITLTSFSTAQQSVGPSEFVVEDNTVSVDSNGASAIRVILERGGPLNEILIRGNAITQIGTGQAGAIEIAVNTSSLDVDVIGNYIDGADFNGGVSIHQFVDGNTSARIMNNSISGQVSHGGLEGGIVTRVTDGIGTFEIVNNSIAFNEAGVIVDGLGDPLAATIANNVIAFNDVGLFARGDDVSNASNLVFGNGTDIFTAGPGTLTVDPLFASSSAPLDALALRSDSPARDAGDDAHVPVDLLVDITGGPRMRGSSVDIGAYEVPEPADALAAAVSIGSLVVRTRLRRTPRRGRV